ncbi:MAG: 30S ribosome-binding factor RbfA [Pseudomonadota bacterium]
MSKFSAKGPSQRQLRVGEMVRHALTELLQRGEIQSDVLEKEVISVSEVAMSPDLKIATVYVSRLGGGEAKPIIKALSENAKQIRGRISPKLSQMKYMPSFRFREDTSFNNFSRIDALLHSDAVQRDLKQDEE